MSRQAGTASPFPTCLLPSITSPYAPRHAATYHTSHHTPPISLALLFSSVRKRHRLYICPHTEPSTSSIFNSTFAFFPTPTLCMYASQQCQPLYLLYKTVGWTAVDPSILLSWQPSFGIAIPFPSRLPGQEEEGRRDWKNRHASLRGTGTDGQTCPSLGHFYHQPATTRPPPPSHLSFLSMWWCGLGRGWETA